MKMKGSPENGQKGVVEAVKAASRKVLTSVSHAVSSIGRNRKAALACAAVAVALVAGGTAVAVSVSQGAMGERPEASAVVPGAEADLPEQGSVSVALDVTADGYTDESSPLVLTVSGTSESGDKVDFAHAVTPAEVSGGTASVDLDPGTYTVGWVSPINADGSVYRVPEKSELKVDAPAASPDSDADPAANDPGFPPDTAPEDTASDTTAADPSTGGGKTDDDATEAEKPSVDAVLEPVPADQVTKEDLDKIKDELADAVGKGDDTLTGDKGTSATDTADKNAGNAPASKTDDQKTAEGAEKPEEQKPADGGQTNPDQPASSGGQASGNTEGNTSSGGSAGGNTSSGGTTKPAHSHSWVTKQVQVGTKQVQVGTKQVQVGTEPIYENKQVQVGTKYVYVTSDGKEFYDSSVEDYCASMLRDHGVLVHYWDEPRPIYETQKVQVGTKPIYETQPVYENQPVYETRTVCSSCGATK